MVLGATLTALTLLPDRTRVARFLFIWYPAPGIWHRQLVSNTAWPSALTC